jgi:hypothetical protein
MIDTSPARAYRWSVQLVMRLTPRQLRGFLLGARTLEQLEDNLGAADLHLSAVETARLDEASAPIVDDYPYGDLGMSQRDRALPAPRSFTPNPDRLFRQ